MRTKWRPKQTWMEAINKDMLILHVTKMMALSDQRIPIKRENSIEQLHDLLAL